MEFTTSRAFFSNDSATTEIYTITAQQSSTGLPRLIQPSTVMVTASATLNLRIEFDTGIR
jgi:hypothetical protein